MAEDYEVEEESLIEMKNMLKRKLHMNNVRRLSKKRDELSQLVVQRNTIQKLKGQLTDLKPTVSAVYSPQYAVKDREIKGYLVYLLDMKDHYEKEISTKQELIQQKDVQIQDLNRLLCKVTNQEAQVRRSLPAKSDEFVRLEHLSNKMEQINKRVGIMRQENNEIMKNILELKKFHVQFRRFEKDSRKKICLLKDQVQERLTSAVAAYEEKEEFMNRRDVFQERRQQELRRTAITENSLSLCVQKTDRNEKFGKLQNRLRIDSRLAEAEEIIEKGITGLEGILEENKELYSAISLASGEMTSDEIEETFKVKDDDTGSIFSYLDEVLKDIERMQLQINQINKENKNMISTLSITDREMRSDIERSQEVVKEKMQEAEELSSSKQESQNQLDSLVEGVRSLYGKICFDDESALDKNLLDDTNVADYLQEIEKRVLDILIAVELLEIEELSKDIAPPIVLGTEEEEVVDDSSDVGSLVSVQPRVLRSKCDLRTLSDLEEEETFLEFEQVAEKSTKAVEEMEAATVADKSDAED